MSETGDLRLRSPQATRIRPNNSPITRRHFLRKGALAVIGAAGGLAAVGGIAAKEIGKLIEDSRKPPADIHVIIENNRVVRSPDNKPQPVEVSFIPQKGSTTEFNQGKIIIRRAPTTGPGQEELFDPSGILTHYATRVIGGTYIGVSPEGKAWGQQKMNDSPPVGLWFKLTDKTGHPVNPQGNPLQSNEKPYYAAGTFVTVNQQTSK